MAVADVALSARARGISTHLLSRQALDALTTAPDLAGLVRRLGRAGAFAEGAAESADVFAVERAVGAQAAGRLHTLFRWGRASTGVLEVFAADADRRSLRALLRGAVQGTPAGERLRGLLATPTLPQPLLVSLAGQPSGRAVIGTLVDRGYRGAEALLPLAEQAATRLLAIEAALLDAFARRASCAAGRDPVLAEYVAGVIDTGNAVTAALLGADPPDVDATTLFVGGGRSLTRDAFSSAVDSARRQTGTGLRGADAAGIERAFLESTLLRLRRLARQNPLSTAPMLRVLLLIDAQARDLRALAWGAALAAPTPVRTRTLVTPR